jgi:hypothetical protein
MNWVRELFKRRNKCVDCRVRIGDGVERCPLCEEARRDSQVVHSFHAKHRNAESRGEL